MNERIDFSIVSANVLENHEHIGVEGTEIPRFTPASMTHHCAGLMWLEHRCPRQGRHDLVELQGLYLVDSNSPCDHVDSTAASAASAAEWCYLPA
jgi:hypothetical protein